jgi:hypothetical protein
MGDTNGEVLRNLGEKEGSHGGTALTAFFLEI